MKSHAHIQQPIGRQSNVPDDIGSAWQNFSDTSFLKLVKCRHVSLRVLDVVNAAMKWYFRSTGLMVRSMKLSCDSINQLCWQPFPVKRIMHRYPP